MLVAMGVTTPELRLFALNGEGDLHLLDSQEMPDTARQILFHPSGRFLYVADTAARLRAYTVGSRGQLELTESIDHAGGELGDHPPGRGD
jgi:hypothetical protein